MGHFLKGLVLAALLATSAQPVLAQSAPSYLTNPSKAATWGSITGTLSSQSDLNTALSGKEPSITAGTTGQYWRGDKSWQTLNSTAVGLGNVTNTSDANKPVSTAQQAALDLKVDTSTYTTGLAGKVDVATAPSVICQGAAQQTVTGTATETQVLSCSVPGGTLLANGRLALVFEGTFTGATASRTINVYFGGTLLLGSTPASTITTYSEVMSIANRNATGSQRWKDVEVKGTNAVNPASGTSAIDTASTQTVVVKIQLNASDSATLDSWQLLAYPKS